MTLALSLKVNDGLVIAADSATTMIQISANGQQDIVNIYDNANKLVALHKKLPVGLVTWGLGNIGNSSMATLAKDFRKEITHDKDKMVDVENFSIEDIAKRFYQFIYTDRYQQQNLKSSIGFLIGGYSTGKDHPEEWIIEVDKNGNCLGPRLNRGPDNTGCTWFGQPEAITRLLLGYSGGIRAVLQKAGLDSKKINEIMGIAAQYLPAQIVSPSMPIQDAIDIAEFLVDLTIKYIKYTPGQQTVGGPIELAAITKHEGFKWVSRKLYYTDQFNPKEVLDHG